MWLPVPVVIGGIRAYHFQTSPKHDLRAARLRTTLSEARQSHQIHLTNWTQVSPTHSHHSNVHINKYSV